MLDKFVYLTLYVSCVFGGVMAMWLTTLCTDKGWPLWLVFAAAVALEMILLRRLEIPFPFGIT